MIKEYWHGERDPAERFHHLKVLLALTDIMPPPPPPKKKKKKKKKKLPNIKEIPIVICQKINMQQHFTGVQKPPETASTVAYFKIFLRGACPSLGMLYLLHAMIPTPPVYLSLASHSKHA